MKEPKLPVDFNEMIEDDLVLLSNTDFKKNSEGESVQIKEGMRITIYEDESGLSDDSETLTAKGTVVLNPYRHKHNWASHVKWCCRIDVKGIYKEP